MKKKFTNFRYNSIFIGCLLYVLSSLISVTSNIFIKKVMVKYNLPAWESIAIRQSIIVIILIPFMIKEKFNFFNWNNLKPNLIRNIIYTLSIGLAHIAFMYMPINEGISLQFISPILASILAIFFLHEKNTIFVWVALLFCIIGAFIIHKPTIGLTEIKIAYFILMLSILMKGVVSVLNRKLALKFSISTLTFYTHILILLVSLCFSYQFIKAPIDVFLILGCIGVLYLLEYIFIYKAQSLCPVTVLQPLDFSKIIYSIILSNIVLGEKTTFVQVIGSLVILLGFIVMIIGKNKQR